MRKPVRNKGRSETVPLFVHVTLHEVHAGCLSHGFDGMSHVASTLTCSPVFRL